MNSFIGILNDIFDREPEDSKEILYEFSCNYKKVKKDKLLSKDQILENLHLSECDDEIKITFHFSDGLAYINNKDIENDDYDDYLNSNQFELVDVDVKINKKIKDNCLNIYNLKVFSNFLSDCNFKDHFFNFTKIFSECNNFIQFRSLDDSEFIFKTKTISFSSKDYYAETINRDEMLCKRNDASLFLDRIKFKLIPEDFDVIELSKFDYMEIVDIFKKLCRILSYIYVANSSFIQNEKVVLSFNPKNKGEEYSFDELTKNDTISKIYDWVYKDENCVDKAGIARNIINIYCHSKNDILHIDDKIFNSIKSDFQIYQKNHIEQYIELKNKISDHIVETTKQIQDLSHELSNALRDTFVSISAFVMVSFLTNSIDFSMLLNKTLPRNFKLVCFVFVFLCVIYFVSTIFTFREKWKWLENSYNDLKKNYKDVLDEEDIKEAFNNDDSFNKMKDNYHKFKNVIYLFWSIVLLLMVVFMLLFSF